MSGIEVFVGAETYAMRERLRCAIGEEPRVEIMKPGFFASVANDATLGNDTGMSEVDGIVIVFEGYIVGHPARGAALRCALIEDFRRRGDMFVRDWIGSFRMAMHCDGETWLYSDHVASRPWFRAWINGGACWSASATRLASLLPARSLDGANLLQFLSSGRFFAGGSPYRELRQADPGVCHHFTAGGESRSVWFEHTMAPRPRPENALLEELEALCDAAVLRHYARAEAPSLMLSGGYDSRYLLNTLDARLGCEHGVPAWLWCEADDDHDPQSDLAWARREAVRMGVPFVFFPIKARIAECFDAMFEAQSGMTEHIFTHTDEREACRAIADMLGVRSLLRADEVFGPNGGSMSTADEALAKVGMLRIDTAMHGLAGAPPAWCEAHAAQRDALAQLAQTPDDLRDLLYRRERLPALQAHLHSQRRPWIETHTPFLDPPLLRFVASLTAEHRTDKRLFRKSFLRRFPTDGFARNPGGFSWSRRLRRGSPQAVFLLDRLRALPEPLNSGYWLALAASAIDGGVRADPNDPTGTPVIKRAARAVVLGHWLNRWPAFH